MPAPVTRLSSAVSGSCRADLHSPWPRPFAPPPPPRIAPPCSLASQLLWPRPTSHTRASSATAPRLPDADRHLHQGDGQTWDLPVSDTILLRVMCSSTPAGRTVPRMTVLLVLRSAVETTSVPTVRIFRGSITHPTQQLCTLRGRRYRRLTQHSPPGGLLSLTWAGLAPADRASLLAPSSTHPTKHRYGAASTPRHAGGRFAMVSGGFGFSG